MIRPSHSSHNDIDQVNHNTHRKEELTMITDGEHNVSHKRGSSEMTAIVEKLTRPAGHPVVAILTFTLQPSRKTATATALSGDSFLPPPTRPHPSSPAT